MADKENEVKPTIYALLTFLCEGKRVEQIQPVADHLKPKFFAVVDLRTSGALTTLRIPIRSARTLEDAYMMFDAAVQIGLADFQDEMRKQRLIVPGA